MCDEALCGVHFLVDGMNVVGTRPDGWWRDRPKARRALVDELSGLAATGEVVTVVFDGRATSGEIDRAAVVGVTAVFAPGGRNAADDVVVKLIPGLQSVAAGAGALVVVTSDRALVQRVRSLGAEVEGSKEFLRRLNAAGG